MTSPISSPIDSPVEVPAERLATDSGLYVHVPFCARACPYCDFDFEVNRRPDVAAYLAGLATEWCSRQLPKRLAARTVYVGGGTPSVLGAEGMNELLGFIASRIHPGGAAEWSVELNPEHVDEALLAAMRPWVTRVSLGVQTLSPTGLRQLGRTHDAARATAAIAACRDHGLRVSADLIVGWPGQTMDELERDVDTVVGSGASHVSIYALTIEPGTPWEKLVARGQRRLPVVDAQAEALVHAQRRLQTHGLDHYEVASYAKPGAQCRHNQMYWTARDYVGVGPSAASAHYGARGDVTRRTNVRGFRSWLHTEAAPGEVEHLCPQDAAAEALWTGLRLLEGVDVGRLLQRFEGVDEAWLRRRVEPQVARGNLQWVQGGARLRVAPKRWLFHDETCAALL